MKLTHDNSKLSNDIDKIMGVFSGEDGGVQFIKFKIVVDNLNTQVIVDDNREAKLILDIVYDFARLLDFVTR